MKKRTNGTGSVYYLGGGRRSPWIALAPGAKRQTIGTYSTREAAQAALADYIVRPYDLDLANITLQGLYERWRGSEFARSLAKPTVAGINTAFNNSATLHSAVFRGIKAFQMQSVIDSLQGAASKGQIKTLFGHMYRYALFLDVDARPFHDMLLVPSVESAEKIPFSTEEEAALWERRGDVDADAALVMMYSGWRISELLTMRVEAGVMIGGVKSRAGRGRTVPVHPKISNIVRREWPNTVKSLRDHWHIPGHTPHDCRVTFRTRLHAAHADSVCIDRLMGHKSPSVGEAVYTKVTAEELAATVALLQ